jgi:hypothetical protein
LALSSFTKTFCALALVLAAHSANLFPQSLSRMHCQKTLIFRRHSTAHLDLAKDIRIFSSSQVGISVPLFCVDISRSTHHFNCGTASFCWSQSLQIIFTLGQSLRIYLSAWVYDPERYFESVNMDAPLCSCVAHFVCRSTGVAAIIHLFYHLALDC